MHANKAAVLLQATSATAAAKQTDDGPQFTMCVATATGASYHPLPYMPSSCSVYDLAKKSFCVSTTAGCTGASARAHL
jgi:hypothetical protein